MIERTTIGAAALALGAACSSHALDVNEYAASASTSSVSGASSSSSSSSSSGGAGGSATTSVTTHPSGTLLPGQTTCTVIETTNIPEPDFNHLAMCTPITYATNPPSGGNHWPIWAAFKIYAAAPPHEMTVHCLEHGAVVLSYACPDGCPEAVTSLTTVFNQQADPVCLMTPGGPPARMVLTPDADLIPSGSSGAMIAAATWGATYTATCFDQASLQAFITAHYDHGREDLCSDGQDTEADPPCPDAG